MSGTDRCLASGELSTLILHGDAIILHLKGARGGYLETKTFAISRLSGIEFRSAGLFSHGKLTLKFGGDMEKIVFRNQQTDSFELIRDALLLAMK